MFYMGSNREYIVGGNTMVIYRPHRGGLKEAMAEAKEFNSIDEMKRYICDKHNRSIPWFQIKTN